MNAEAIEEVRTGTQAGRILEAGADTEAYINYKQFGLLARAYY